MSSPNAEAIECWNQILEPKFTRFRRTLTTGFAAHGAAALDRHPPALGARVIDVGCGWGDTTIDLGLRVGPTGSVLGIDCVESFIAAGRDEAGRAGLDQVRFVVGDGQTHAFEPGHDLVFGRFGTMFFQSPVLALRNLGRAVRPDGRLLMVVWRRLEENVWTAVPKRIALSHLPPPDDAAPTCGPGPFSMAGQEMVRDILTAAGWRDATWQATDVDLNLGPLDDAIALQLAIGPAGEIVREAGELGEQKRAVIVAELREALAGYLDAAGEVRVPSASWCVTARWPG